MQPTIVQYQPQPYMVRITATQHLFNTLTQATRAAPSPLSTDLLAILAVVGSPRLLMLLLVLVVRSPGILMLLRALVSLLLALVGLGSIGNTHCGRGTSRHRGWGARHRLWYSSRRRLGSF